MMKQPSFNFNDQALHDAMFVTSEGIARGDGCDQCEAHWTNHRLIHRPGCLYVEYLEAIERRWNAS